MRQHLKPQAPSPKPQSGFTLIEILVTVAVLAVVFSMVTMNFRSMFDSTRLRAACRGIGDVFAYAVSRSYTTAERHTLVFDLEKNTYHVRLGPEDEVDARQMFHGFLGKGVSFTDVHVGYQKYDPPGVLCIEISPLGVTSDFVVNLEDEEGREFAVSVNSLVQSVQMHEKYVAYEDLQELSEE